jgi:hypothetical protein
MVSSKPTARTCLNSSRPRGVRSRDSKMAWRRPFASGECRLSHVTEKDNGGEVVADPQFGWEQLKGRLLGDIAQNDMILPIQLAICLDSLRRLRFIDTREYTKAGSSKGLERLFVERHLREAERICQLPEGSLLEALALMAPDDQKTVAVSQHEFQQELGTPPPSDDKIEKIIGHLERHWILRKGPGDQLLLYHDFLARSIREAVRRKAQWLDEVLSMAKRLASEWQADSASGKPAMRELPGDAPSAKRFRVAFSFAGERREFVAKVAETLANQFGKNAVLYDKYHEAEFARSDLGIYLPNLYHDDSDLIVVVVCPKYQEKEWCGLEWSAIHAMLKNRKNDEVMLCRFEYASVKGLYDTAGFVELDHKTPEQAAGLILQRLNANGTKLGKTKP